jgi:hypothetical protein
MRSISPHPRSATLIAPTVCEPLVGRYSMNCAPGVGHYSLRVGRNGSRPVVRGAPARHLESTAGPSGTGKSAASATARSADRAPTGLGLSCHRTGAVRRGRNLTDKCTDVNYRFGRPRGRDSGLGVGSLVRRSCCVAFRGLFPAILRQMWLPGHESVRIVHASVRFVAESTGDFTRETAA